MYWLARITGARLLTLEWLEMSIWKKFMFHDLRYAASTWSKSSVSKYIIKVGTPWSYHGSDVQSERKVHRYEVNSLFPIFKIQITLNRHISAFNLNLSKLPFISPLLKSVLLFFVRVVSQWSGQQLKQWQGQWNTPPKVMCMY